MPILPVQAPASYAPLVAVGFGSTGGAATPVDVATPLPVRATLPGAGAIPLVGTASASGSVGPFAPDLGRAIWLTLSGTWSGSVQLLRSVDGGATRTPLTIGGRAWGRYTGIVNEIVAEETVAGATYFLAIALTSGIVGYALQQ